VIESIPFELYNSLKTKSEVRIVNLNPAGFHAMLRFNHLHAPFNNPKIRQAAALAMNQDAVLRTQVGVPELYWRCNSMYPCKSAYASATGTESIAFNLKRARELLKEAGYDGTPVVLMQPTDIAPIAKLPVVATQLLRQAGFKVDMQAMDWQTLVARRAKKDPPAQGGWNAFLTVWTAADGAHPAVALALNGGCEKAWFGWPCDAELEKLRERFARAQSEAERKALAQQVQVRAAAVVTHAPLGEYMIPTATRKNIDGFLAGLLPTFWNVEKK
jgi:peptide/nickel transport system substrate-binding protein